MEVNPIDVQRHLKGISYPASKQDVVATAESNGASDEVVQQLQAANAERFEGPDDVQAALS